MPSKKARKGRNPALERHFGVYKGTAEAGNSRVGMVGTAGSVVGSAREALAPVRPCPAHPRGSQGREQPGACRDTISPLFPHRSDGDSGSRRAPAPVRGEPQAVLPGDAGGPSGAPALPALRQRRRGGCLPARGRLSGGSGSDNAGHRAPGVSAPSPGAGSPSTRPASTS